MPPISSSLRRPPMLPRAQTERPAEVRTAVVTRAQAPATAAKPKAVEELPEDYECGAMGAMKALGFLAGAGASSVAGAVTGFAVGGPVGAVAGLVAGAVLGGGGMAGLFKLLG